MKNKYELFKQIIIECNYDNTYKMAWGKSIVELSSKYDLSKEKVIIKFDEIAKKYIKYYWNQIIFFDLKQSTNILKTLIIIKYIKELINIYIDYDYELKEISKINFENTKIKAAYQQTIEKIVEILKNDVSWRFKIINGKDTEIYNYAKGNEYIEIDTNLLNEINNNKSELLNTIDYRWILILKSINGYPRNNKKIKLSSDDKIDENILNNIRKLLG